LSPAVPNESAHQLVWACAVQSSPKQEEKKMCRAIRTLSVGTILFATTIFTGCGEEPRDAHQGALINLTGCLQKGADSGDYLLTVVNQPSEAVGTAGVVSPAEVAREETRAATHTYRVSGKGFDLESLVGRQLRVSGTIEEGSDVWRKTREAKQDAAESAQPQVPRIKEGDLAKVNMTTVDKINEVCPGK
jgi:hypothetical protein